MSDIYFASKKGNKLLGKELNNKSILNFPLRFDLGYIAKQMKKHYPYATGFNVYSQDGKKLIYTYTYDR